MARRLLWVIPMLLLCFTYMGCGSSGTEDGSGGDNDGEVTELDEGGSGESGTVGTSGYVIPTMPSGTAIKSLVTAANSNGVRASISFGSVTLPEALVEATSSVSSTEVQEPDVSYSVSDLPYYLEFDADSRTISRVADYSATPQGEARRNIDITYRCDNGDEYSYVEVRLNDIDNDLMNDSDEYERSAVPLMNRSFGWIWLSAENAAIYRLSATDTATIATGLLSIPITTGFNLADSGDALSDFDSDGVTNQDELTTGKNPFVYTGSGIFEAQSNYSADSNIWFGMSAADFDGDGDGDIVAVSHGENNVYYYEGNGDGTFKNSISYTTGTSPQVVAVADFDNDGYEDMAVTSFHDEEVNVFINDGDGTFADKADYNCGEDDSQARSVTAADFNGDKYPDLVVTHSNACYLSVLLNDGDGTFGARSDYTTCTSHSGNALEGVIALDVDGDLDLDIAVISATVKILKNDGSGVFGEAATYGGGGFGLVAYDADDDGDLDIVYSGSGTSLGILFNDGTGVYGMPTHEVYLVDEDGNDVLDDNGDPITVEANITYTVPSSPRGKVIAMDANGDGFIDIATANYESNSVSILFGQVASNGDILGNLTSYSLTSDAWNYHPACLVAFDADGDGDIDLATGSDETSEGSGALTVLLNQSH